MLLDNMCHTSNSLSLGTKDSIVAQECWLQCSSVCPFNRPSLSLGREIISRTKSNHTHSGHQKLETTMSPGFGNMSGKGWHLSRICPVIRPCCSLQLNNDCNCNIILNMRNPMPSRDFTVMTLMMMWVTQQCVIGILTSWSRRMFSGFKSL